jgi:ketosteroid isomerase-like protein
MPETSPFPTLVKQWQDAANQGNAGAVAALYATDAVFCATEGILHGRSDIQNDLDGQFKAGFSDIALTNEEDHQQPGANWAYSVGAWSSNAGAVKGYWSVLWVQQGTSWQIQQHTLVAIPTSPQVLPR